MEIFEDISEHLHPWMIFILAGATLIFKFFSKPISKAIEILFRKKATNMIETKGFYFEIFGALMIVCLGLFLFKY